MSEIFYRKWRPRAFVELAGQEHVSKTLTNALGSGRIAHAYLFAGPRGTGKTSTGRLLAKALNCRDRRDGEPCNVCESCLSFLAGRAMDLIELDAASNRGIDEIRSLRDKVAFAPGAGEYKVYLIDEVHMLTDAAFNALLKTLEEPPPHVVFILATTEAHKLPPTIASRCQRFDFRRIPLAAAIETLKRVCEGESIGCEPAALELIARSGTGSLRDSENLLDQLATSYGKDLTLEQVRAGLGLIGDERAGRLARIVLAGDLGGGLELIASVRDDSLDLRQFQRELVDELRALLMVKSGLEPADGVTAERRADLQAAVADVPTPRLLTALRAFGEADLKADPNSTLPLDIALAECVLVDGQTGRLANGQGSTAEPVAPTRPVTPPPSPPPSVRRVTSEPQPSSSHPEPGSPEPGRRVEGRAPSQPNVPSGMKAVTSAGTSADITPSTTPKPIEAAPTAPASPPVNGGLHDPADLAAVRQQMRPIFDAVRARSVTLGALLNGGCDIIDASESGLVFGFKFPFHADRAAASANLDVLSEIASMVMKRPVTVSCVHDPNVEDWKLRDSTSRSPLVRAAQEMGARVLNAEASAAEPEDQP